MKRLTRADAKAIDEKAIHTYRIPELLLVENAAIAVARIAMHMLKQKPAPVFVFAGGGNNGADGMAGARHLLLAGCEVTIVSLFDPERLSPAAKSHYEIDRAMGISIIAIDQFQFDQALRPLIIDALLGTGSTKPPRANMAAAIEAMNRSGLPILSVDLPSGLDCETGLPLGSQCVCATKTVSFAAEKIGFANPSSRKFTGGVIVAGIGCPL